MKNNVSSGLRNRWPPGDPPGDSPRGEVASKTQAPTAKVNTKRPPVKAPRPPVPEHSSTSSQNNRPEVTSRGCTPSSPTKDIMPTNTRNSTAAAKSNPPVVTAGPGGRALDQYGAFIWRNCAFEMAKGGVVSAPTVTRMEAPKTAAPVRKAAHGSGKRKVDQFGAFVWKDGAFETE